MCGRYGRRADKQRIAEWMQAHDMNVFDDSYFAPSFNVAPQSMQPVVRLDSETGERELTVMRWGLIPFWILLANSGGAAEVSKKKTIPGRQGNLRIGGDPPGTRKFGVLRRSLSPLAILHQLSRRTVQEPALKVVGGIREPLRRCLISLQRSRRSQVSDILVKNRSKQAPASSPDWSLEAVSRPPETLRPLRGQPVAVLV